MCRIAALSMSLLLCISTVTFSSVILVPQHQPYIQSAIDIASDGDVIVVSDGVYTNYGNVYLDFLGKEITVKSANGPANCIIDGGEFSQLAVVDFHGGETENTIFRGFTILDGTYGARISCVDSSPRIVDCIIEASDPSVPGLGIYCYNSSPTVLSCTIRNNSQGGISLLSCESPNVLGSTITENGMTGVHCNGSSPNISNCLISLHDECGIVCANNSSPQIIDTDIIDNETSTQGAGIYCTTTSSPSLLRCAVSNNTAQYYGGGIFCSGSSHISMDDCSINHNTANWDGGGICCADNSTMNLVNCEVNYNTCFRSGGGVYVDYTVGPTLVNTHVDFNTSLYSGGGIYCFGAGMALLECTVSNNDIAHTSTSFHGGGVYCNGQSTLISETTMNGNSSPGNGGGVYQIGSGFEYINLMVSGNTAGVHGGGLYCQSSGGTITNSIVFNNTAGSNAGGVYTAESSIENVLIVGNASTVGAGLVHMGSGHIGSCTISGNIAQSHGGGVHCNTHTPEIRNCIIWGNAPDTIYHTSGTPPDITFSDIEGNWYGSGNIDADPLFVNGPFGEYYLSQLGAQGQNSPCIDRGDALASQVCFYDTVDEYGVPQLNCMDFFATHSYQVRDLGQVDMGYHYTPTAIELVEASLTCTPSEGTLPFDMTITAEVTNTYAMQYRQVSGRVDLKLAEGASYSSWRAGYLNLAPDESVQYQWLQTIPALQTVTGENVFSLVIEDVTPAPYNQPPYPPAGDTATATCTVTGIAP